MGENGGLKRMNHTVAIVIFKKESSHDPKDNNFLCDSE